MSQPTFASSDLAQHFTTGVASGRNEAAMPSSLDADSARFTSQVPHEYQPQSTLAQVHLSSNGNSANDAARQMPDGQFLPTANGTSPSTNAADTPLRLVGSLPI